MQLLLLLAGCLALVTAADVSLSELQPIALFSDSCTEAYDTPITYCDDIQFAPFDGFSTCTRDCWSQLNTLVTTIQRGCQYDGAKPDTVIAHAFQGDLANWMCARGPYASSTPTVASGTATNAKATSTSASATSTATSTSSSETSTTESSSTETSASSTESTSTSVASSSSTTLSTSTSASSTSTSAESTSAAPSSTTAQSRPTRTIDSTPFDQTVALNAAPDDKKKQRDLLITKIVVPTVAYHREKRMSQNNPQDLESGSDSMEMTRDAGNRANGDAPTRAGRGTALNERGTPILPNTRMPSYGSCDEDKSGSVAKDEPGRGHPLRHQIGSDVLDFGDSPLIWPGPLTRRLLDKKRRMMLSWLGSSKACSSSRSTVKRKDSISAPDTASRVQPPIPSIPHHIINRFETKLGGDGPTPLTTKGKTVFSLFGLDAAQAEASANIDTELEDLTNKPARPRANAISVPNGRSELLKQVTQTAAPDKPRCLSITKYLEEISKIGANGTEQSDRATAPAAAGSATIKNGAVHGPGELQDDVHKAALQQLKTETSPGANGESISDPLQQHAHVIPSQDVGKSKEPKIRQHATAGIASTEHEMNRMIEHNPYPSTPRTTPGRTDHDAPAVVKAVTGSKPLRASSKARSPATPQRAKSSSKPKQVKTAKPNAPDKSKDMSTATSPGFTGMLQAADKGAVARVGSKQRKEREGVCAGKR